MEEKHFIWDPSMSVNVKMIDEQHKRIVSALDDLYQAVLSGKENEGVVKAIDDLNNYAKFHFATEEKYFDEFNYEGSEEHKGEHEKFKVKVADFESKLNTDGGKILAELIDFLEDWIVYHVNSLDKKYTKCFNEHGLY